MESGPDVVVDKALLERIISLHGLVLEDDIVVPSLLDGKARGGGPCRRGSVASRRVEAPAARQRRLQVQKRVARCGRLLCRDSRRCGPVGFLPGLLLRPLSLDLLELAQQLGSLVLVVLFLVLAVILLLLIVVVLPLAVLDCRCFSLSLAVPVGLRRSRRTAEVNLVFVVLAVRIVPVERRSVFYDLAPLGRLLVLLLLRGADGCALDEPSCKRRRALALFGGREPLALPPGGLLCARKLELQVPPCDLACRSLACLPEFELGVPGDVLDRELARPGADVLGLGGLSRGSSSSTDGENTIMSSSVAWLVVTALTAMDRLHSLPTWVDLDGRVEQYRQQCQRVERHCQVLWSVLNRLRAVDMLYGWV